MQTLVATSISAQGAEMQTSPFRCTGRQRTETEIRPFCVPKKNNPNLILVGEGFGLFFAWSTKDDNRFDDMLRNAGIADLCLRLASFTPPFG